MSLSHIVVGNNAHVYASPVCKEVIHNYWITEGTRVSLQEIPWRRCGFGIVKDSAKQNTSVMKLVTAAT